MALPSSGAISFSQINTELGVSSTAQRSLNDSTTRTLFGKASGAIAMSDGYGKANQFAFTISSNQTNANLRTLAISAGWNQSSKVVATIASGIYISSNSTGTPALTINGSFPGGVELVNSGYIVGMGGAGGAGKSQSGGTTFGGAAGSSGGGALSVSTSVTITNNGTIGGGGGGGGGGGTAWYVHGMCGPGDIKGGGGGGGGRASAASNSSGGAGGSASGGSNSRSGSAGGAGTVSSAGSGGAGGSLYGVYGGTGGTGGGWGANGSSGNSGGGAPYTTGGLGGGAGGYAVSGNGYVTWSATGTRLGGIS